MKGMLSALHIQFSQSINTHKGPCSRAALYAPSNAQPNPNDNHDTMCADWQGTRLAVNGWYTECKKSRND